MHAGWINHEELLYTSLTLLTSVRDARLVN